MEIHGERLQVSEVREIHIWDAIRWSQIGRCHLIRCMQGGKHRASTRQAQELSAAIGAPFGVRDRDVATERVAHEDHLLDAHGHTPCLESVHEEGLGLLHAALDAVPEVPARSAREAAAEGIDGVHTSGSASAVLLTDSRPYSTV